MARTIREIQQSIIDQKSSSPDLAGLSSTSNVSIWQLWTYVIAVCQWTLENLYDSHKEEVSAIIATQKPHTLQWYVRMAKLFQYGVVLPADSDTYTNPTDDDTVSIVKYAAAVELSGMLRIKVAKLAGGALAPLTSPELTAFSGYMNRIKDAGVRLQLTSDNPDNLRLSLNIFYDPLVLDNSGAKLSSPGGTPVKDAVNVFLDNLPFNGVFVLNFLIQALQQVEGVRIAQVVGASANYGATAFVPIPVEYLPDAGYMVLDTSFFDANISYTAHGPL